MEEYLGLPRGMHDRNAEWVAHETEILKLHDVCGRSIGCDVTKYSPVSFKSTFIRECNTANDKIYEFDDRAGRRLVLTCDSTASVLREYISHKNYLPRRISFVSPIFRYRTDSAHNRFFTQIGYSIINESKEVAGVDLHLIQLIQAMKSLTDSGGIRTKIYLNDYDAFRNLISKYIDCQEVKGFIYKFQFADYEEREHLIKSTVCDEREQEQLIKIFSSEAKLIKPEYNFLDNQLDLPREYGEVYAMAQAMRQSIGEEIYFYGADLHCIETIDKYTVRLVVNDSFAIAEGGEYSGFANRFDNNIFSFWSVASGIEPLERTGEWNYRENKDDRVAVYSYGASIFFVIQVMSEIKKRGLIPCYLGECSAVKSAVRKAQKVYSKCVIIGEREEQNMEVRIKDFNDGTYKCIKVAR